MIRFQFVDDHRAEYSVKRMCTVLKLTRSSFYKWKATQALRVARTCADGLLGARIAAVFDEENGLYGAKRITASLNEAKELARVNHKKVARIMKNMNLRGFTKRRRCVTTKRSTANPVFADLVKRRFHADAPNQVYVGDITYLPCKNGTTMYLATVIDLYSRKLAGFAIADHMRTSLVIEALEHANTVRGGLDGAIFHSDHGSVGGFNRSSQHLDHGGVRRWQQQTGTRRPVTYQRSLVGSGVPTGR